MASRTNSKTHRSERDQRHQQAESQVHRAGPDQRQQGQRKGHRQQDNGEQG